MSLYSAKSLEDIAAFFDAQAARANIRADHTTATEKKLLGREAVIWSQAANIVRQTTLTAEGRT